LFFFSSSFSVKIGDYFLFLLQLSSCAVTIVFNFVILPNYVFHPPLPPLPSHNTRQDGAHPIALNSDRKEVYSHGSDIEQQSFEQQY